MKFVCIMRIFLQLTFAYLSVFMLCLGLLIHSLIISNIILYHFLRIMNNWTIDNNWIALDKVANSIK